jgi:uncharacterized membrane protein
MNKTLFGIVIGLMGCYFFAQKENISTLIALIIILWSNNINLLVHFEKMLNNKKFRS